jgi:hypothetical protein
VNQHDKLRWVILALCLLSFGRGAIDLGARSLWWDESLTHYRATRLGLGSILRNEMHFLSGTEYVSIPPDNHPPLYFVLVHGVVRVAGSSEYALRFLSLAAGVLLVPLLYQTGAQAFGPQAGALAALFGAASPLYLWAQQEARPYSLGTLLAVASFYALLRMVQECALFDPSRAHRWRARELAWPAAYVTLTAMLLLTHYQGLLLLPAHGAILLLARCRDKRLLAGAGLATGTVAALVGAWGLRMMPAQSEIPGYAFIPLPTLLQDVLRSFPLGVMGTEIGAAAWIGVALLAAAVVVAVRRRETTGRHSLYLLACAFLPVAAIYALSYVRPAYMNVRHLIFASPFYLLLLPAAYVEVRSRAAKLAAGAALCALLAAMVWASQSYRVHFIKEDHRAWGRYLSTHVRQGDLVVINPGAVADLFAIYADTPGDVIGLPRIDATADETVGTVAALASEYERIWVAQSLTPHWANPGDLTLNWLKENAQVFAFQGMSSDTTTVQVYGFRTRQPVYDLPPTLGADPLDLGPLRLLGVQAEDSRVSAGEAALLNVYWSVEEAPGREYRMTLSLVDEQGDSWSTLDRAAGNAYPTTRWPEGRIVRDQVDLAVPVGTPPGRYQLSLSLYPADGSGPALAARDPDTGEAQGVIVPVGQVEVAHPDGPVRRDEVQVSHPLDARYGPLALIGHNYDGGTVQPGDVLLLDAMWRAVGRPRQDAAFALKLADKGGEVRVKSLVPPASGYPCSEWSRGEYVRGQYRLRVPIDTPPGQYAILLGPSQDAWHWPWQAAPVTLGEVKVQQVDGGRSFEIPPMQVETRAVLGDQVELLGYDLAAGEVGAGGVLSCTLYWRALESVSQDYTVFTHLVDAEGRTWGQWDNPPGRGESPTTRWTPGQVIADPYEIPVSPDAPPSILTLEVGMYDPRSMTRLPVIDSAGAAIGDKVLLAEIEVVGR